MEIYLNLNPDQAGMSEGERTGLCTCIRHLGSTLKSTRQRGFLLKTCREDYIYFSSLINSIRFTVYFLLFSYLLVVFAAADFPAAPPAPSAATAAPPGAETRPSASGSPSRSLLLTSDTKWHISTQHLKAAQQTCTIILISPEIK